MDAECETDANHMSYLSQSAHPAAAEELDGRRHDAPCCYSSLNVFRQKLKYHLLVRRQGACGERRRSDATRVRDDNGRRDGVKEVEAKKRGKMSI